MQGKQVQTQLPVYKTYYRDQDLDTLTNFQMEDILKEIIGHVCFKISARVCSSLKL